MRGCGRPVALDVDLDAVTAGALTVVGVRVCLFATVAAVTVFDGVPPVLCFVVTLDPRELVERDELEFDLLERDPLDELERPPPLEPPPLEPPPLEPPLDEPERPAPADPVPERRANLAPPR